MKRKKSLALFFLLLSLACLMEAIDIYYNPLYSHTGVVFIGTCTATGAFAILSAFFWRAGSSAR